MSDEAITATASMTDTTSEKPQRAQFPLDAEGNERFVEALTDWKTEEVVREDKPQNRLQKRFDKLTRQVYEGQEELGRALQLNEQLRHDIGTLMTANQELVQVNDALVANLNQALAVVAAQKDAQALHLMLAQENQKLRSDLRIALRQIKQLKG